MDDDLSDQDGGTDNAAGLNTQILHLTIARRLRDLEDNITQELTLLKNYEDVLRYEEDPRRRAKYNREIIQIRQSMATYHAEYGDLRSHLGPQQSVQMDAIGDQLDQIDRKLLSLINAHQEMSDQIEELTKTLLLHYPVAEQSLIKDIANQLSESQLRVVQLVLREVESDRVESDRLAALLEAVQKEMSFLQGRNEVLTGHAEIAEAIQSPALDLKHKVKVTLPIIPLLLNYEAEVALGSGVNLETLWERLVAKVRRR